jgi:serine/threonine-protein kinase HipA
VKAREIERLFVHRAGERAGELQRTEHGASFIYGVEYAAVHRGDASFAVAFQLPVRPEPFTTSGVNLHPFFAGLLPEGLRLRALVRSVKTSEDDLFTLLAQVGEDAIGDVALTVTDAVPRERSLEIDEAGLAAVSFRELLERSLEYGDDTTHSTMSGAQPKVSAAMISFPVRSRARGAAYLLKLTPSEYPRLVENEAFFMKVARSAGLETASAKLVHDARGESALLVQRFDRQVRADGSIARLHQEDACQLLNRYPADKYRLKLADVAGALDVCEAPLVAKFEMLRLQAFSYLIANGDLHAKNVSVLSHGHSVGLSPAYDVLSTLPYGDAKLALSMEGRDDRLRAKDFIAFGERLGIQPPATKRMLAKLIDCVGPWTERLSEIGLDAKKSRHLERVMRERLDALAPAVS